MAEVKEVKPGKYFHYKGNYYEVLGVGRHADNLDEFVVYRALYNSEKFGNNAIWVRPKAKFTETIIIDGKETPRFKYVGEK